MDKQLMEYFIEKTDARFDKIDKKLDMLLHFKWQIIGGATAVSILVTVSLQLFIGRS